MHAPNVTKMHPAAGSHPNSLEKLIDRSTRPLATLKGSTSKGREGREQEVGKGRDQKERERKGGRGREMQEMEFCPSRILKASTVLALFCERRLQGFIYTP